MPVVDCFNDNKGRLRMSFTNGRHRFAIARELRYPLVPVQIPRDSGGFLAQSKPLRSIEVKIFRIRRPSHPGITAEALRPS